MLNERLYLFTNSTWDFITKVAISIALMSLIGPLSISTGDGVPITLQSLLVLFFPLIFGWKIGSLAVLGYLTLGLMGLPVFSLFESGTGVLKDVTAGFLFGFLVAAVLCGYLGEQVEKRKTLMFFLLLVLGHLIILLMGFIWKWSILPPVNGWFTEVSKFLPGLAIKSAIGLLLYQILLRAAVPKEEYYNKKS